MDRLVFLDESGAKTNMTRRYGRAPRGERCSFFVPHGHWQTTTMNSAVRWCGVIPQATMIFDGPTDGMIFRGYIQHCLAPVLRHGDVVVMDNLAAHKVQGVAEAIEAVGAEVVYLPPYSPAPRRFEALIPAIADAFHRVKQDKCANYFRSCGYAASDR